MTDSYEDLGLIAAEELPDNYVAEPVTLDDLLKSAGGGEIDILGAWNISTCAGICCYLPGEGGYMAHTGMLETGEYNRRAAEIANVAKRKDAEVSLVRTGKTGEALWDSIKTPLEENGVVPEVFHAPVDGDYEGTLALDVNTGELYRFEPSEEMVSQDGFISEERAKSD